MVAGVIDAAMHRPVELFGVQPPMPARVSDVMFDE